MLERERELIDALGLGSDGGGGWSGPTGGPITTDKRDKPVMEFRTRLARVDDDPPWRRGSHDVVLLHHEGARLEVVDDTGGRTFADPTAPQLVVPASRRHVVRPVGGYALWSEAVVPGGGAWSYDEGATPARVDGESAPVREEDRLVELLDLESHVEGGYYRQIYTSPDTVGTPGGTRVRANSIYYLLDRQSPIGRLHSNVSDITHFLHSGGPVRYQVVSPEGELRDVLLGYDVAAGQRPVFTCPGGWWKTSSLPEGVSHGLISEIVAPGFDFADQRLIGVDELRSRHPRHVERLASHTAQHQEDR
ncbi:cupin domain-containing protein [Umezawaea tangerina]|uniref:Putative cupin superfamily sugar epimerase n=1 Tax=Umezawaea tangerina TaxID=84725 RepID=A0A2T0T487_9PSEU|nr:cupin domain-containing protein [Umezawaea tangerina]PRY40486.1 putative cupin superfamily sugar epimerase [Umezawaea tangerina]